jgi:molybdate transport system permease protein
MIDFSPTDYQAMALSARVAFSATLASVPFGFAAAYLLVFVRLPAKTLLNGLISLPLVLPPVVVGYLLLLSLGSHSWLGGLLSEMGFRIIFTWKAAVIASMVVGFPLLVRSICIGMEEIDQRLIQASRTLGARTTPCLR